MPRPSLFQHPLSRLAAALGAAAALSVVPACDPLDPGTEGEDSWSVLWELGSTGAVTAMTGVGNGSVLAVGGRTATGSPIILRGTSTSVETVGAPAGVRGILRAIAGGADITTGVAVGDGGLVLSYSGAGTVLTPISGVSEDIDLFGVAADGNGYLLVGQMLIPEAEPPERGIAMRLANGTTTVVGDLPVGAEVGGAFKAAWNAPDGTMYIVGWTDEILVRKNNTWSATPADGFRLNAVHGNGSIVVAVGGRTRATVLEDDGSGFRDISPTGAPVFHGVHVSDTGVVTAVGGDGSIWERRGSTWRSLTGLPTTLGDVRALHVDASGQKWVGGGQVATEPFEGGFVWFSAASTP